MCSVGKGRKSGGPQGAAVGDLVVGQSYDLVVDGVTYRGARLSVVRSTGVFRRPSGVTFTLGSGDSLSLAVSKVSGRRVVVSSSGVPVVVFAAAPVIPVVSAPGNSAGTSCKPVSGLEDADPTREHSVGAESRQNGSQAGSGTVAGRGDNQDGDQEDDGKGAAGVVVQFPDGGRSGSGHGEDNGGDGEDGTPGSVVPVVKPAPVIPGGLVGDEDSTDTELEATHGAGGGMDSVNYLMVRWRRKKTMELARSIWSVVCAENDRERNLVPAAQWNDWVKMRDRMEGWMDSGDTGKVFQFIDALGSMSAARKVRGVATGVQGEFSKTTVVRRRMS